MLGTIAQTIGLVLAVNAKRRGIPVVNWPEGSIFQFCNCVSFVGRGMPTVSSFGIPIKIVGKSATIDDPNLWLQTLPKNMAKAQLNVFWRNDPRISDRESVGFANGGPIFVAQITGDVPETWHGVWQVTDQANENKKIWSVVYRNTPTTPIQIAARSISEARNEMIAVLNDVTLFDQQHKLGFEGPFSAAAEALRSVDPIAGWYHSDMIPDRLLSLECRQLFASAAKAWVFGGMGSWNDNMWFDGDSFSRYKELSERLFRAIIEALQVTTNASASNI